MAHLREEGALLRAEGGELRVEPLVGLLLLDADGDVEDQLRLLLLRLPARVGIGKLGGEPENFTDLQNQLGIRYVLVPCSV